MNRPASQDGGGSGCAGCLIMIGIGIFVIAVGIGVLSMLNGAT